MASITIKNIPPSLHQALRQRARKNARSVQREAVLCLQESVGLGSGDREAVRERVRRRRQQMKGSISQKQVLHWIEEDRRWL